MKITVIENANAKINLTLDIIGIRADGYHNIDSIMQSVSLCDIIELTYDSSGNGISLCTDAMELPVGEDNLCCRAACAYLDASETGGSAEIKLIKRIPISAGLGGGSSDAAAVLRALDRVSGHPMKQEKLLRIAASIGADVPFCLYGGCMRAQGIGERLTVLPPLTRCPVVIARAGEGISAGEAYRLFDLAPVFTDASRKIAESREELSKLIPLFSNTFEQAVFKVRPQAEQLCSLMLSHGALCSHMSGSGDAVYAIFADDLTASETCDMLEKRGIFAVCCYPC